MRLSSVTAAVLTAGTIAVAQGQAPSSTSPDPGTASTPHQQAAIQSHWNKDAAGGSVDPATFVTKAAEGGLTEVALSKAAASSARDPKIKQFAQQMVRDHSKANEQLASLAKSKGLSVPLSLDAEHRAIVQKLSNKKGAEFDAAYVKQMQEDHANTVALFQSATKSTDADLAAFANNTLPTLKQHEHLADDLR